MATVILQSSAGERTLTEPELLALMWAWDIAAHQPYGTGGGAVSRLAVAGGAFSQKHCGQLLAFCRIARERLAPMPLAVHKPKYGSNVCLGSAAGYQLVLDSKLAYVNHNAKDAAVFIGKTRQPAGTTPQTLGDCPAFASAVEAVEAHAKSGQVTAVHSDPKVYF
jgi:hypothetical protein